VAANAYSVPRCGIEPHEGGGGPAGSLTITLDVERSLDSKVIGEIIDSVIRAEERPLLSSLVALARHEKFVYGARSHVRERHSFEDWDQG
jgi:hypothetical protein